MKDDRVEGIPNPGGLDPVEVAASETAADASETNAAEADAYSPAILETDARSLEDGAGEAEETVRRLARARAQARWGAPIFTGVVAPALLAAVISFLIHPEFLKELLGAPVSFSHWLALALIFAPGITVASALSARLLTADRPLHPRALSGMAAVFGLVGALLALAVTLFLVVFAGWIGMMIYAAFPAHTAIKYLLLFLLYGGVLFLLLAPYFVVGGLALGLVNGAGIELLYNRQKLVHLPLPLFSVTLAGVISVFVVIYVLLIGSILPPPPALLP